MRIWISPCSVYLTAFETRLPSTWRRRSTSPTTAPGTVGSTRQTSSSFLLSARPAKTSPTCSANSRTSKTSRTSSILPASIFESSRMSLMICIIVSAAERIEST